MRDHPYFSFLHLLNRPARYIGREFNSKFQEPPKEHSFLLIFPDLYEIGMSHLGMRILYSMLNREPDITCERLFAPDIDLEKELRARNIPLFSLERRRRPADFDICGFSLQHELNYTNILTNLELGGIPALSSEREESHPLVMGGGPLAAHPEPIADFFDLFFVGDAEEKLVELIRTAGTLRKSGVRRRKILEILEENFPFIYCPGLHEPVKRGRFLVHEKTVSKREIVRDISPHKFPSDFPVAEIEAVFDRGGIEIARGCTEGCRFCEAGYIYRPVRERTPEDVENAARRLVEECGFNEVSLTALSTADCAGTPEMIVSLSEYLSLQNATLSVSSLRAYGLDEKLMEILSNLRTTGLTFAPEAGSERLRRVINKNISDEDFFKGIEKAFRHGWQRLKLYFMIGLPTETEDDLRGIVRMSEDALSIARRYAGNRASITVSFSTFVPKPHTAFQWCAINSIEEMTEKINFLKRLLRKRGIEFKWHKPEMSFLEGILGRGDRKLSAVIITAYDLGCRFDGWDDRFDFGKWSKAFKVSGIDLQEISDEIDTSEQLPWSHIDMGIKTDFLRKEYKNALNEKSTPPCQKPLYMAKKESAHRRIVCYNCGVDCNLDEAIERWEKRVESILVRPPVVKKSEPGFAYEFHYTKLSSASYLSHLDVTRLIPRIFRRAGVMPAYSRGFHSMPLISYPEPLPLGYRSICERIVVRTEVEIVSPGADGDFLKRLNSYSIEGLVFRGFKKVALSYKFTPPLKERFIIECERDLLSECQLTDCAFFRLEKPEECDLREFPLASYSLEISYADGKKSRPHKLIEEACRVKFPPHCFILVSQTFSKEITA